MKQRCESLFLCGMLALLFSCGKDNKKNIRLVKVGLSVFRQNDVNAFSLVTQNYPTTSSEFSLAKRLPITAFLECASIYKRERFNPANLKHRYSIDWRWKKRYIISDLFMNEVLKRHLGYSEKELRKYYDEHKSEFISSFHYDSAGNRCTTTAVTPFDVDSKRQIAEKLFLRDYKPDSTFLATNTLPLNDENAVKGRWLKYMRIEGYQEIFLKKFFKEKYGITYPDSLDYLVGEKKILSHKDLDVIMTWVSEERRDRLRNNKQSLIKFAKLLMRWLLFSERAKATGYASQPIIKATLKWAWRYEIAQRYITNTIGQAAKKEAFIDSTMALYSYWDKYGNPGRIIDTTKKNDHFKHLLEQETKDRFNALLDKIRRNANIKFLTQGWRDEKDNDPVKLLLQADSLRDDGSITKAETIYRTLANEFVFTPQGKEALIELAKLQTEKQMYTQAINNYRLVLITDTDAGRRCNFMLTIGFIYDEYLDRPEMAEINYKWVLKNTPDCELADNAEFMMLHLGEQMMSVEEMQAELRRQGKKVETSNTNTTGLTVESEQIKEMTSASD